MDTITPEKRSWTMSRVKSKNTKPEIFVRRHLHTLGFRYRLHNSKLPGCPDIVLAKWHTVIFVNGCFWHQHPGCKNARIPKSNVDFWKAKFEKNVSRDQKEHKALMKAGWRVIVIWECQVKETLPVLEKMIKNTGEENS